MSAGKLSWRGYWIRKLSSDVMALRRVGSIWPSFTVSESVVSCGL